MFKGKTVLITGAAVGIGRACAIQFANEHANVILVDINEETLNKTEQEIKKITDGVISFVCDVSDNEAVLSVVEKSLNYFGKIDILVNNAALWRDAATLRESDIELWKKYIDVNVMGTVYFTKAVIESMVENNYGRIINVASVAGVYGNARMSHYSATKGAVIGLTSALAKEVAQYNITVNAVSPGTVSPATDLDIDYYEETDMCYKGRTGTDRENADLICFLASEKASYISGQNIQIDGCRKKM
jgi:NAD(P)-dependent dehydrogenase (short-subunit alcohol dehydrogenase family)